MVLRKQTLSLKIYYLKIKYPYSLTNTHIHAEELKTPTAVNVKKSFTLL